MELYYRLIRNDELSEMLHTQWSEKDEYGRAIEKLIKPSDAILVYKGDKRVPYGFDAVPRITYLKKKVRNGNWLNPDVKRKYLIVLNAHRIDALKLSEICKILEISNPDGFDELYREKEHLSKAYYRIGNVKYITPDYIESAFPLTYSEELIYGATFVRHPLVGYEEMLVPLEKYYKFLSEQNFNEFLHILIKLGVKKVELIQSENELMKNALKAYSGYREYLSISGSVAKVNEKKSRLYWGMEFSGKEVQSEEISETFLESHPFHKNNGTIIAMIEGIRSGNRNRTYTVERSFTGNYGLNIESAISVLGVDGGFDFQKERHMDEKSTFNVLY